MKKKSKCVLKGRVPGIKRIFYVPAEQLQPGILYQALAKMPIAVNAVMQEISFVGVPVLSWSSNMVNSAYSEKSTLEFDSYENLPISKNLCFAVEAVDGRQLLIGQRESRFPIINFEESTGAKSEKACRKYTITHIGKISVIEVVF